MITFFYFSKDAKDRFRKPTDRWILWKLTRMKKGEYDDVTRVVAKKIVSCQTYICIYLVNFICLYI